MKCYGRNAEDHCCYINGSPCKFLEENTEPGSRWTCGLRRELGSWQKVITDPRYFQEPDSPGEAFKNTPYGNCDIYQCVDCALRERNEIAGAR